MPAIPYSDEDYEKLETIDREVAYLRSLLREPLSITDVVPSDFDESVDYELALIGGNYYVNAIKSGASYKVAISDEDGNFINGDGDVVADPIIDAVVQIGDLDGLRKEMLMAGRTFVEDMIGAKIYQYEEEKSTIESRYEGEDPMDVAHRRREEEMNESQLDRYEADDEIELTVLEKLKSSNFMQTGWTTRKDDIIEELIDLGFDIGESSYDTIEFTNPDEERMDLPKDRYYKIDLEYIGSNTIAFTYSGYEEV